MILTSSGNNLETTAVKSLHTRKSNLFVPWYIPKLQIAADQENIVEKGR